MEPDSERLLRYLSGEGTADDIAVVHGWAAASPSHEKELATLQRLWRLGPSGAERESADHVWSAIRAQIAEPSSHTLETGRPTRTWASRAWAVGAVAVATLGIVTLAVLNRRDANTPEHNRAQASGVRYTTAIGQRALVTLSDGSRVTLAPQTTVLLDAGFGTTSRTVTLTGEAYFEVVNAARAPFVVQTGTVTTRVLGTAFTVRRYPEDRNVHVAVVSGRVNVSAATPRKPSVTLATGAVAIINDSSAMTTTGGTTRYTAWIDGQLGFREAPTHEVLAALTRWYGYQFRLADPALARQNLTVWISTESSRDALATLKLMLDVDLSFEGNVVTLSPRSKTQKSTQMPREPQRFISPYNREVGR